MDRQAAALEQVLALLTRLAQRRHLIRQQSLLHVVAQEGVRGSDAAVRRAANLRRIEGFLLGLGGLFRRDHADLRIGHAVEHQVAALNGLIRVPDRVQLNGVLHQPRQHGRLGEREVLGRRAEIVLRRSLDAVRAVSVVGDVEVTLEDLPLLEALLQRHGVASLDDLAFDGHLGGLLDAFVVALGGGRFHPDELHVLLRQRRSALSVAGQRREEGAAEALEVDGAVLEEAVILDGHLRVLHVGRDGVERHVDAVLVEERGQHFAVGHQNARTLRRDRRFEVCRDVLQRFGGDVDAASGEGHEGHRQPG